MKQLPITAALLTKMERLNKQHEKKRLLLIRPLDKEIAHHLASVEELQKIRAKLLGEANSNGRARGTAHERTSATVAPKATTKASGKRDRRSPEELKGIATDLIARIKKAGKEGLSGGELREAAIKGHRGYKLFLIMPFFDQWAKGQGVKMVGEKRQARYVA